MIKRFLESSGFLQKISENYKSFADFLNIRNKFATLISFSLRIFRKSMTIISELQKTRNRSDIKHSESNMYVQVHCRLK